MELVVIKVIRRIKMKFLLKSLGLVTLLVAVIELFSFFSSDNIGIHTALAWGKQNTAVNTNGTFNKSIQSNNKLKASLNSVTGFDTTAPFVVSTSPFAGSSDVDKSNLSIKIEFNEEIKLGPNYSDIRLVDGLGQVDTEVRATGNYLEIRPLNNLQYRKTYTVIVPAGAIKDGAENPLAEEYSFNFTTKTGYTTIHFNSNSCTLNIGETKNQVVTADREDGTTEDVTALVIYVSSNPVVATIDQSGKITAVGAGTAIITAILPSNGQRAQLNITVRSSSTLPQVSQVFLNGYSITLQPGISKMLKVMALYVDGKLADVTDQASYVSSDENIAVVSKLGVITAVGFGNTTITATYQGKAASIDVTVDSQVVLNSISFNSDLYNLEKDKTLNFYVTASYSDGTTRDITSEAAYTSDNTAIANVAQNGLIIGIGEGITMIHAAYEGKMAVASVKVDPIFVLRVTSITINNISYSMYEGDTQQITVTAKYSDGTEKDITNLASYQSSDGNVATVSNTGLITAVKYGTAQISAAFEGVTTRVPINVLPSVTGITLNTNNTELHSGYIKILTVTAQYSNGRNVNATNLASYASSDENVATVSNMGVITTVGAGNATITAAYGGKTAAAYVTVVLKYGDVDGDGKVTSTDYSLVKRYINGRIFSFPSSEGRVAADVDGNGSITDADCEFIRQFVKGQIIKFPRE